MENATGVFRGDNFTTHEPPYEYYSLMFKIVSVTIAIVVFIVGFLGNVLVIIVVYRTKSMHTPTNCYLLSLSVADCLVLLSATLPAVPEPFYQVNEWPWGQALCSILIFLQYLGVDASSLSMTAFTVERYIAICHPMKAHRICTVKRATTIILVLWGFTVMYTSPWLGLTTVITKKETGIQMCTFRLEREQYVFYYMTDFIAFYIVPLLIAACLYTLIARILFRSDITKTTGGQRKVTNDRGQCRLKTSSNSRKQVVRMLCVIVVVFATLWLPYRTIVVYNSFSNRKYLDTWFMLFCRVMVYINGAINPILYNAMSVKFRRAFQKFLCCGSDLKVKEVTTDVTCYDKNRLSNGIAHPDNKYMMLTMKQLGGSSCSLSQKIRV